MSNLDRDLAEMRRLGYTSYGKYKLDYPNTMPEPPKKESEAFQTVRHQVSYDALYEYVCSFCGKQFTTIRVGVQYCSTKCCRAAAKKRCIERKRSESGEAPITIVRCGECGKEFQKGLPFLKYCSKECQKKAYRRRNKEWYDRQKGAI